MDWQKETVIDSGSDSWTETDFLFLKEMRSVKLMDSYLKRLMVIYLETHWDSCSMIMMDLHLDSCFYSQMDYHLEIMMDSCSLTRKVTQMDFRLQEVYQSSFPHLLYRQSQMSYSDLPMVMQRGSYLDFSTETCLAT